MRFRNPSRLVALRNTRITLVDKYKYNERTLREKDRHRISYN